MLSPPAHSLCYTMNTYMMKHSVITLKCKWRYTAWLPWQQHNLIGQNLFSFIISLIFNVEPCKMAHWKAYQLCFIPKYPPYRISANHVTQMLHFDWPIPIFLHYFINIQHRALQKRLFGKLIDYAIFQNIRHLVTWQKRCIYMLSSMLTFLWVTLGAFYIKPELLLKYSIYAPFHST